MKKKDEQKYQAILNAAATLIIDGSVGDVSTTKIARAAGISQSSLYVYFTSREQLLTALYIRELTNLYQGDLALDVSDLTFAATLRLYLQQLFDYAVAHPGSITVIQKLKETMRQETVDAPKVRAIVATSRVQQLLAAGIANHDLRQVDLSLHRNIIFSTVKLHVDNLNQGVYSRASMPFSTVCDMIMAAVLAK
ncbi:TetR/AcrR family transcriptional regulator [Furfurilactobacillus sp. WILCCON 0119]